MHIDDPDELQPGEDPDFDSDDMSDLVDPYVEPPPIPGSEEGKGGLRQRLESEPVVPTAFKTIVKTLVIVASIISTLFVLFLLYIYITCMNMDFFLA